MLLRWPLQLYVVHLSIKSVFCAHEVGGNIGIQNHRNQICPYRSKCIWSYRIVWSFVYGHIEPDEMCHVSCLLVHWRLNLIIVKDWWKDRLPKVTTKNIFSFVDLNERPNLIQSTIWIKSDGHFYTIKLYDTWFHILQILSSLKVTWLSFSLSPFSIYFFHTLCDAPWFGPVLDLSSFGFLFSFRRACKSGEHAIEWKTFTESWIN